MPTRSSLTIDRAGSSCHFIETKGQNNRFAFAPSAVKSGNWGQRATALSLLSDHSEPRRHTATQMWAPQMPPQMPQQMPQQMPPQMLPGAFGYCPTPQTELGWVKRLFGSFERRLNDVNGEAIV